jgi:hypothetical protein
MDRLLLLDSSGVSDALDTLNLVGATIGIRAVAEPVAGRVRIVQAGPGNQVGQPSASPRRRSWRRSQARCS